MLFIQQNLLTNIIKLGIILLDDEEWLDFVSEHRNGTYNGEQFDLIIGVVANDDVYITFQVYLSRLLTKE